MSSEISTKIKSRYVKVVFLTDERENHPVFFQYVHRLNKTIPVFDYVIACTFREFSSNNIVNYPIVSSSFEHVEDFILHPFMYSSTSIDPAENKNPHIHKTEINSTSNSITTISHYYNGLQKRYDSWHGIKSDENTEMLNLTVDFSSISTKTNNPQDLFEEIPTSKIEYKDNNGNLISQELKIENQQNKIFTVSTKQLGQINYPKNSILKIYWKINWKQLLSINLTQKKSEFNSTNEDNVVNFDNSSKNLHFNIDKIENLQIQQDTIGSSQTITQDKRKTIDEIIKLLTNKIPSSKLIADEKEDVISELKSIEHLKNSEHPRWSRIKEKIQSISKIIENDKETFASVISLIGSFLSM